MIKSDFNNKLVVITGAGGVICSCLAKGLARQNARIAVLDLNLDAALKVANEIKEEGFVAEAFSCNVLDKASLKACHEEILNKMGKCDILINGAGGNNKKAQTTDEYFDPEHMNDESNQDFFKLPAEGFEFVFGLNMTGTLLTTQEFALDMINRSGCSILNISSMNAFTPLTKIPAYSAAKGAVSNFTKWLSVHFSKVGIRVNAIAPGFFSTIQNKTLLFNSDGTPTARTGKILRNTPMERFGECEELIGATTFLLDSDSASFITGVVLPIDGGFSAYSGV